MAAAEFWSCSDLNLIRPTQSSCGIEKYKKKSFSFRVVAHDNASADNLRQKKIFHRIKFIDIHEWEAKWTNNFDVRDDFLFLWQFFLLPSFVGSKFVVNNFVCWNLWMTIFKLSTKKIFHRCTTNPLFLNENTESMIIEHLACSQKFRPLPPSFSLHVIQPLNWSAELYMWNVMIMKRVKLSNVLN